MTECISKPYTLDNWEARRPLPEGKTIEQLSLWERHYYGRVDYPLDALDYSLYCRWCELVRKKEEAESKGDAATDRIDQMLEYNDALMCERMAAVLLRAHVQQTDPKYTAMVTRQKAERAALDARQREAERVWQQESWEKLKDCI